MTKMTTISEGQQGAAVEDVQQRLATIGLLDPQKVDGVFGPETATAVRAFREKEGLGEGDDVTDKVWAALVDASYSMGDRTLYLRMPYFHGRDVLELQQALGALGFPSGKEDGIFGAYTEDAVRNLHHSWEGKQSIQMQVNLGFARAAGVLERHALCLFGTDEFTRSVASRMSNLSLATNPSSKILSADSLLVRPNESMLLVHIVLPGEAASDETGPRVRYDNADTLALRLSQAIGAAFDKAPARITIELPGTVWADAGEGRSAQHFAITLLDALCVALAQRES